MANFIKQKKFSFKPPVGASLNTSHPLAQGLQAFWLFNEGGGTTLYDLSGNNNTASLTGTTWQQFGNQGTSLNFVGSNSTYGSVPYAPSLNPSNQDFSIAAWFYNTGSSGERIIINHQSHYRLKLQGGGRAALDGSTGATASVTVPTANAWHLVVVTFQNSSSTGKIYLDGKLDNTQVGSLAYSGNTNVIDIGRTSFFGGISNWIGNIGQIMLWGRILGADEIQKLYTDPYAMLQPQKDILVAPPPASAVQYVSFLAALGVG